MEGDDGSSAISNQSTVIKAQEAMERLDVLVCGQCHSVFHFIEKFQEHRTKEGSCSKTSLICDTNDYRQNAQVCPFLLWKNTQVQDSSDKEASDDWTLHQKWCNMDTKEKETWIIEGKTQAQAFTKISNAKMEDTVMQSNINFESANPIIVPTVVRNKQQEETDKVKKDSAKLLETKKRKNEYMKIGVDKKEKPRLKPLIKESMSGKVTTEEDADLSNEKYIVDKTLVKRFNTKKRYSEFVNKWKCYPHEDNTCESAKAIAASKSLLNQFERSHTKKTESKEAQQKANTKVVARGSLPLQKSVRKTESFVDDFSQPGPSIPRPGPRRSMRSSKSKAMNQIKQLYGSIKKEKNELLGEGTIDDSESDSEKEGSSVAKETTSDTGSDEEWTEESEDQRLLSHSNVIHRANNRANAQSSKFNKTSFSCTDLTTSLGLQSADEAKCSQSPVLMDNAEQIVKVDSKQMPNLASGLNVISQEESIIELDLSSIGKKSVKGSSTMQGVVMVQSRDNTNVFIYKCKKCSKMFDEHISSAQALKRSNSEVHTDDKRYKCETCDKTFKYKSLLNRHLLIHTGEKPYKCEFCEKGFNQKSSLNTHKRAMHFNKVCNVRKNDFDNKQDMINDLGIKQPDVDERPYKCETCSATFKRLGDLKQHTGIHTGEKYVCEICNKAFTFRSNLIRHKHTHSDTKPHVCSICNKGFIIKWRLLAHMQKDHISDTVVKD